MNKAQIDQVKIHIEAYYALGLSNILAQQHSHISDLSNVQIGEYTAQEFLSASNKVFNQFKEEIDTVFAKALPYSYQFQNEYGGADLNQDLAGYLQNINNRNFPAAVLHLNRLIHYQAINGFWEKSKRKYFRSSEVSVQQDKERIELVSNHLEATSQRLETLLKVLETSKDDLDSFTSVKRSELSEIEALVTASRNHSSEITNLQSQAAVLIEKINSLLQASEEKKADSDQLLIETRAQLQTLKTTFENLEQNILEQKNDFETLKQDFKSKLTFVESKHAYFEQRNQYLDDLIGREVGASLFETFKQRKTELTDSIKFWKWSIPTIALVSAFWIVYLFWGTDPASISWQLLLINSIKTLPVLGLFFFTISQYTKERNFQEEYAFKSAVALTVNSYAEQLKETTNQDKLIMDSVQTIYMPPSKQKVDQQKDGASSIQNLKEMIGQVKEIKDIVGDSKS